MLILEYHWTQKFTCCISSSQTAWRTVERHEGWCHTSPCNHRQDTSCRCTAANVREEHPQPISQPGPRGQLSEPITGLTADASAPLTNDLTHFTLTDWGQSLSPHHHVADVLPLSHHVQYSHASPSCSAPTTHLRAQKSISSAAGFQKTWSVVVRWGRMEEWLLFVADYRQVFLHLWDSDLTSVTWALLNCRKLHWRVLFCLYSQVKSVYVTICHMKLEKLDRRRSSMFGVYWCFVVILIIKEFKGFWCAHFHL